MYVLAQFSERSSFDWIHKIRAKAGKDEIKHSDMVWVRAASPKDTELWRSVDQAIETATIYVVDPGTYVQHVVAELLESGAEFGHDFDLRSAVDMAAEQIVRDTPGYQLTNARAALEFASLASPLSVLPLGFQPMSQPELPIPRDVLAKLGGGLRNAVRFAARSYSFFDGDLPEEFEVDDFAATVRYTVRGTKNRLAEMRIRTALSTPRIFDTEDDKSIGILNETADQMSTTISGVPALRPLIREAASTGIDPIQAADIAAGTARDIIDRNGVRALADKFRRVFVNGIDLQNLLRHS